MAGTYNSQSLINAGSDGALYALKVFYQESGLLPWGSLNFSGVDLGVELTATVIK